MIPISFLAVTAYLVDDAPIWDSLVTLDAEILAHNESGVTIRETRRPLSDTLRLSLRYRTLLQSTGLTAFRNALQAITTQRILCPLWLYQFDAGVTPTVTADYYVLMGDGSAPEIKTAADLPFARPAYPLMVGRLDDLPDPSLLIDDVAVVDISFTENDVYFITPASFTPPTGLSTISGTKKLFPFRPNWATQPRSGGASVHIERQAVGQSRKSADAFYAQPSQRTVEEVFTLQNFEPWQMLRMFLDFRGSKTRFWLPAGISDAQLTTDVAAIDTAITISDPAGRGANDTLLLDDLVNRVPVKVTSTAGSTWNLSAAVGTPFIKTQTRIESLILARFNYDRLTVTWDNLEAASCRCRFAELPWETAAVAGETDGTTIGEMATVAYLFHFTVDYPGSTQHWYYTGFEKDLSDGSNTYVSGHWEHDNITEVDSLERQQSTLRTRISSGNPLGLMVPFQLEWPLMVEVYECEVSGGTASNLRRLFYGEVVEAQPDGPYISATLRSMGAMLDRRAPRWIIGPSCNAIVFDSLCGLLEADWKWQATVTSYNPTTRQLALTSVARLSGERAGVIAGYFAAGYLYFGAGQAVQYRTISDNFASVGSTITLIVGTPFTTSPSVGATVTFHPGCDGQFTTCVKKFNNRSNFRNFPFMPVGNPSVMKVSKNVTAGGKK